MARPSPFDRTRQALERLAGDAEGLGSEIQVGRHRVPVLTGEFWTSRQRQASSLHEVSYRACYKPQLPRHFILALTEPGERVLDPFGGRGTTAIEAALLGRCIASNDVNPLSRLLAAPRLALPDPRAITQRLEDIPKAGADADGLSLDMFYHPDTESELRALRAWLLERESRGTEDAVDRWIRMVATNRLTGHSPGFFSVYTLPPNQAVTAEKQRQINAKRNQVPPYRDTHGLIAKKTRQLLSDVTDGDRDNLASADGRWLTGDARNLDLPPDSVALTVTSPPFLDVVQYAADNWLRCWFNGLDAEVIGRGITMARTLEAWSAVMGPVFHELFRVTRPGGHVAFEVGEVRKGTVRLEETVLPLGLAAGFEPLGVLINAQTFTKTAHIWGVDNMEAGTNSNRIVVFRKP